MALPSSRACCRILGSRVATPPPASASSIAYDSARRPCTDRPPITRRHHPSGRPHRRPFATGGQYQDMSSEELASLQTNLLDEASYLTRTLYRKCLKSVQVLAAGNARDEDDFTEREKQELNQFGEGSVDLDRISMAPPVDRTNELSSRANYYKAFAREHFDGHWNLLGAHGFHIGEEGNMAHGLGAVGGGGERWNQYQGGHHHLGSQMGAQYQGGQGDAQKDSAAKDNEPFMWREEQVQQFVYLLRSGEEKRRWILSDYEFEDPCNQSKEDGKSSQGWSDEVEERLKAFEEQSSSLVQEMYRRKGWMHSSAQGQNVNEDDAFFSDSDSD